MSKQLEFLLALKNTKFNRALDASQAKVRVAGKKMAANIKPAIAGFKKLAKSITVVGGAAGVAAAATGIYALQAIMRDSIALANEQEAAEAKLDAVVKATGESAGLTADEMKKFAGELQNVTTYGDEVTISALAILATFKQIKGDAFKRATRAAQDMATVIGTDLNTNIMLLGKALNDPIQGVSALGRAGVKLTASQKAMIKSLVESGQQLKAQDIILKELEGQFGGAAAAARNTFGGMSDAVKGARDDFKEAIGRIITKNEFFITGLKLLEQQLKSWTAELDNNGAAAREYAKTVGMSVLSATDAALTGINMMYSGFSGLSGVFQITAASALYLSGGIFKIVQASAALTDKLGLTSGATEEWAINAQAAFAAAADLTQKSKENFQEMANGSTKIDAAKDALESFSAAMDKVGTDEISKPIDNAKTSSKEYEDQLVRVNGVWKQNKKIMGSVEPEIDKIVRKLDALDGKKVNVTITEKTVQQRAMGGLMHMFASGGKLAGFGGGDRIPALLEAGEFVIRKEAVARFGAGIFNTLNSLRLPELPKFATGGPVAGAGGETVNINLTLPAANGPVAVQADRYNATKLLQDVQRMQRLRSA